MATGINTDSVTASVGNGVTYAYGRHIVGGNVLLRDDTDPDFPVLFIGLGEGPWDGYEVDSAGVPLLFLNGVQLQAAEVHFHPGVDGQLSSGTPGDLTPVSTGGDQKVDLWFPLVNSANGAVSTSLVANITSGAATLQAVSSLNFNVGDQITIDTEDMQIQAMASGTWTVLRPINGTTPAAHTLAATINLKSSIQPLTFSRLAYVAIRFDASIIDPSANDFRGFFRTRKVGIYDGSGTLTSTAYSDSPAWQILDMLLKARGWPTAGINFPSFVQFASDCATNITIGAYLVPRFVSNMFFANLTDFGAALDAMLLNCRGVMSEYNGVISIRMDQIRAPVFAFTKDNIIKGSFQHTFKDTRTAANQLVMTFRDTDNGLAVASIPFDHEAQQARTGRIVPAQMTLGNMPQHQAQRIADYLLTKNIDLNEQVTLAGKDETLKLMPGDVVTVEYDAAPWSIAGAGQETFEVSECTDEPDGSRNFILDLYRDATYSDTAGVPQNLAQTTINKNWAVTEPAPVTSQGAVENKGVGTDGRVYSAVEFTFTPPTSTADPLRVFRGVEIWVKGYLGNATYQRVGKGLTSPFTLAMETTQETVEFRFVPFTKAGVIGTISTSPAVFGIVLDGQDSGPASLSNFTAQTGGTLGNVVRVSFSENTETDIDHYELAVLSAPGTPGNADIFASPVAAGVNATRKQSIDYTHATPGVNIYFYGRAVNTSNIASAWAGPATIGTLAPDGSTDVGVPDAVYGSVSGLVGSPGLFPSIPASSQGIYRGQVLNLLMKASTAVPGGGAYSAAVNAGGIFQLCIELTFSGGNGESSPKLFVFIDDGSLPGSGRKAFDALLSNAVISQARQWFRNYFGDGVVYTDTLNTITTLSQAQDMGDGNFNPNTSSGRNGGLNKVKAQSSNDLTLSTTGGGNKVTSTRLIESTLKLSAPTTEGDTVQTRSGSGDLTFTTQNGSAKVTSPRLIESTLKVSTPTVNTDALAARTGGGVITVSSPMDLSSTRLWLKEYGGGSWPLSGNGEIALWYDGSLMWLVFDDGNHWKVQLT